MTLVAAVAAHRSDLVAARSLMALSLGFHIVLSCIGVALPVVIALAHRRGLRDDDHDALVLARRWSKIAGVLFAVGAVSGTVLSFEMGILWPGLMRRFGSVIGVPFALEGIFFFLEAIFLGIYLYGWNGLPARLHLWTLAPVAVSGVGGTFCILAVNSWMNDPRGFDIAHYATTGRVRAVDPWAAMFNRAVPVQFAHMLCATYVVTGFLFATPYAVAWLRGRRTALVRTGIRLPLLVATVAAPLQLVTGDLAVRNIAAHQPTKMAAVELVTATRAGAPLTVGGILVDGRVRGAIECPDLLSIALHLDRSATVQGLDATPPSLRPNANVVHLSFDLMVGLGTMFLGLGLWLVVERRRRRDPLERRWLVRLVAACGPLSVVALESGWVTTEVGRQPWMVRQVLLVADSVTPRGGIGFVLAAVFAVYLGLIATMALTLRGMSRRWAAGLEVRAPYEPTPDRRGVGTA